jgi:glycosyltransferase involved in cell wall biosynthesis
MAVNHDNHKRVLLISYVFPPAAYVGVYRTLKYCKYLSEHDWTPIVLTANPAGVTQRDDELCREIPDHVSVHRTWDLDPAKWLERLAPPRSRGAASATSTHQPSTVARPGVKHRIVGWAKRVLKTVLLESPDSHVFWVPFAFLRGVVIMLTRRVDVVYSSSPPHSSHLAGYLLARCFGKPHVVDFRDPWIATTRLQAFAKRRVVMNAARVVVVSSGEPGHLHTEFPQLDMTRVAVVTNGYDPDDFAGHVPAVAAAAGEPDTAHFTITHAGTIYRETGQDFFRAVEQVVQADPQLARALRVQLIGDIDPAHRDAVERLKAAGIVRAFGVQPHRAALALAGRSDVLLILQRGGTSPESHIPAKLFEYLFLGKPILAIAQPGSMTEVLTSCGLGVTSPPHEVGRLARTIQALYRDFRAGQLQARPDVAYISRFDRRNLTARFAHVLEEAVSAG